MYATSHVFSASGDKNQYLDMTNVMFCETPWLLNTTDPLRNQVAAQWPQANGSLGRLYAMGVDAYRLAPRLGQLKALPDTRVDGLSGNLGISANQRVDRQMPWAQVRRRRGPAPAGHPALMPERSSAQSGKDAELPSSRAPSTTGSAPVWRRTGYVNAASLIWSCLTAIQ